MYINKKIMTIAMSTLFMIPNTIFALNIYDIRNESLNLSSNRNSNAIDFIKFLEKNNITEKEYKDILKKRDFYENSDVMNWWLIDTGRLVFDDVIFSHPRIKEMFNEIQKANGFDEYETYIVVKNKFSTLDKYILTLFEESLKDYANINNIFEKYFERQPTSNDEILFKSNKTLNKVLYSGKLNRTLNKMEIETIDKGEGYKLFDIKAKDIKVFEEFIKKSNKIDNIEMLYKKTVLNMENIKTQIQRKYKINIHKSLTTNELEKIFDNSINDLVFNEKNAYSLVVEKLFEKNLIKKEDILLNEKPSINDNFLEDNPIYDFLQRLEDIKNENIDKETLTILDAIQGDVKKLYDKNKYFKEKGNLICFKYGDEEYSTGIEVDENEKLSIREAKFVLKKIAEICGGGVVEAKNKTLILTNGEIAITDKLYYEDITEESKKMDYDYLRRFAEKIHIKLYTKIFK